MSFIERFFFYCLSLFGVSFIGGTTVLGGTVAPHSFCLFTFTIASIVVNVFNSGESGLVYRGYINSGELVAVKTGKGIATAIQLFSLLIETFSALLTEVNKERLLKEVTMMLSFDHPNVMSLKGMCFDGEVPLLIMPLMSGGSVLDYVTQNRESLHFTHGSPENEV